MPVEDDFNVYFSSIPGILEQAVSANLDMPRAEFERPAMAIGVPEQSELVKTFMNVLT
jgi:hypothetical protein